ncbi:hypothetical protein CONLIGDRAFT_625296 [Coniochaeta ligniaria NRRL 30616]|uniref:Uncharacterized protein n=1 Tax=Coniochaeta ligniaria NRRL 30616 TaxID=1408157 RepID=A0A1J7I6H7_9PEZI|nr:hypothetical protein CONLIGDRAFT_625296 [Coniochaeta ligniaria NRRL 30616]
MLSSLGPIAAFLVAALPLAHCAPFPAVEERGTCNADNLLRLLRTPSNLPQALPFCSSYLHNPATTIAVSTLTPTNTQYDTLVSTVTSTETSYTTEISSIEPTGTVSTTHVSTLTDVVTQTSLVTTTVSPVAPAAAKTPLSQQVTETYDPSRISSACACLTIPVSTASVVCTAAPVTTTSTTFTTSSAPDVTTIVTLSSTTILPEVTETVTVESTTELEVTTTLVSVLTSTASSSTTLSAAATSGFYVRSYRQQDTSFSGNYLVTSDASATNKIQYSRIAGSNSTAPRLNLTPEGYLTIIKAQLASSAPYGTEAQTWVAYSHLPPVAEPLQFDKLANVLACSNCEPLVFQRVVESGVTYVRITNTAQAVQICSQRSPSSAYLFWLGSGAAAIDSGCFTQQLIVSDIGVSGPFGTPTHY